MFEQDRLQGVLPPVVSPMTPDGALDEHSLERLTRYLLDAGVHGFWMNGSTGEFYAFNDEQRTRAVQLTAKIADHEVPVIAHVGDTSTARTITQACRAKEAGASHIAVMPPYYVDYTQDELREHYRRVAAAAEQPIVVYHMPRLTKSSLSHESILALAQEEVVSGLKDSGNDMTAFRQLIGKARAKDLDLRCFTGGASVTDLGLFLGSVGAMPSTANLTPRYHVAMYHLGRAGEWDQVRTMQEQVEMLIASMRLPRRTHTWSAGAAVTKYVLAARALIDSDRAGEPVEPLDTEEKRHLHRFTVPIVEQMEQAAQSGDVAERSEDGSGNSFARPTSPT